MAKERIGKNERWVLIHCYLKTIEHKLPDDWKLPRTISKATMRFEFLYKSEILLNLFHLEPFRHKMAYYYGEEYFKATGYGIWKDGEYKGFTEEQREEGLIVEKARVNYSRIKRQLTNKGLIEVKRGTLNSDGIRLTNKGKLKARQFLNVNS